MTLRYTITIEKKHYDPMFALGNHVNCNFYGNLFTYLMICKVWTINYAGTTLEFFKSGVAAAMRISEIIEKNIYIV